MQSYVSWRTIALVAAFGVLWVTLCGLDSTATEESLRRVGAGDSLPWWGWMLLVFGVTFAIGFVAVLAGAGGGVLFVPIMIGFFPFHTDFVRGAGILVALSTALVAGPPLLKNRLVTLRPVLPAALVASAFALVGVSLGFALPESAVQIALGALILGVVAIMVLAKRSEYPEVPHPDRLGQALGLKGSYVESSTEKEVNWQTHRTGWGLLTFSGVGIIAGMFGMGAGWANVPVLNLLMGVPLKAAVACSILLLSVTDSVASWAYINQGAVLPALVVPSVVGVMLGSRTGVMIFARVKPGMIRYIVIGLLFLSGLRALLKGFGI